MTETYGLGSVVPLRFLVRDEDTGALVDPTSWDLVVTSPLGATSPTVVHPSAGVFDADYVPAATGGHTAVFTASGAHAGVSQNVFVVTADQQALQTVTASQLRTYLGDVSTSDAVLLEALAAERADQANRCRLDRYDEALREALMRRVARNLAARRVPVASFTSFDGGGTSTRVPQTDPEVKRLEGPHRRRTMG